MALLRMEQVVHSLLSKGSELLSVPADKQRPSESQTFPSPMSPAVVHQQRCDDAGSGKRPPKVRANEPIWKLLRHKIEVPGIEVIFLDDLLSSRRLAQPIAMFEVKDFSLVHVLRDYVDEVHLGLSILVAGLETPGSLSEVLPPLLCLLLQPRVHVTRYETLHTHTFTRNEPGPEKDT